MKTIAKIFLLSLIATSANADIIPIEEVFEPSGNFDPAQYAKVAVVQWAPAMAAQVGVTKAEATRFKKSNLTTIDAFVREAAAAGAFYVTFPEFSVVGYPDIPELPPEEDNFRTREDIQPYVETIPGMTTDHLRKLAKELGIYIQIGLPETDAKTDEYFNSIAVVGPEGTVVASYRKQHLYELEHNYLSEGTKNTVFSTRFGKIGLVICSDLFDSAVLRKYKTSKVDVLSLSTSWAAENSGWGTFTQTARSYGVYFMAANQNYFPDSGVINPNGKGQSHIRQSDGVAYGYIPWAKK